MARASVKVKVSKEEFIRQFSSFLAVVIFLIVCMQTNILHNTVMTVLNSSSYIRLNNFVGKNFDDAVNKIELMLDSDLPAKDKDDCNFFMVPSSIPNSGFGLYAGKSIAEDEQISLTTDENQFYVDSSDMSYIMLHLKHHHMLSNVKILEKDHTEKKMSDKQFSFVASKPIQAGEELYLETTDLENKFESLMNTYHDKLFPKAPVPETYVIADKLLTKINTYIKGHDDRTEKVVKGKSIISILWTPPVLQLVKFVVSTYDEVVGSLFPESRIDWFQAASSGIVSNLMKKKKMVWLRRNAFCLDQLKLEQSTISNNEKGIFLTRDVAKGKVIVSTPVSIFKYQKDSDVSKFCFHPQNSDVIICPLRFQGFVNHAFTNKRQGHNEECTDGPNTHYRWSLSNDSEKTIHSLSADELLQNVQTGLTIDYVATRDIKKGEELTINYGTSWEQAFDNHYKGTDNQSGPFHRPMEFQNDMVPKSLSKIEL